MRIAHFLLGRCNPDSANGVDKTVYHLARHQALMGVNTAVFSLTRKKPIPIPGVEIFTLRGKKSGVLNVKLPFMPKEMIEGLWAWKPDIVHFHSVHIGAFIALAHKLRKRSMPYIVTPHGGFALRKLETVGLRVRAYIKLLEKCYLEGAYFVQAVSRNDTDGLQALGIRAQVVEVPNGIDLAAVPRKVDVSLLRRRYPNIDGRRVFLFLGRLDPVQKGLDLFLEAFAQAGAYNFVLVIVGPDWQGSMARLRSRAEALGLGGRVIFAGPVYGRQKWSYLAGVDVFVHTSRWEGFAFSVLEALAMGKPVLASTGADPEGEINKQGAGFTVPATAKDVAKAIRCLAQLSNEELLRMGSQARAMAEEYDWKHIARSLLEASGA